MVYSIYHFSIKNRLIGEVWMLKMSIFLRYYYAYEHFEAEDANSWL